MALLNSITGGGGSGVRPAPDLTFPGDISAASAAYTVTLNPSTGLITALSLTGKFVIDTIFFTGMTAETVTVKLTVDGVVVWNDTFSLVGTALNLLSKASGSAGSTSSLLCDSSFLLEIQTATDTSVNLFYLARPIL